MKVKAAIFVRKLARGQERAVEKTVLYKNVYGRHE